MADDDDLGPEDIAFLDWVKANATDCTHEEMDRAKAAAEHLLRRPRRLFAEVGHTWARIIVDDEMARGHKKVAAVAFAREKLGLKDRTGRTIWTALKLIRKR